MEEFHQHSHLTLCSHLTLQVAIICNLSRVISGIVFELQWRSIYKYISITNTEKLLENTISISWLGGLLQHQEIPPQCTPIINISILDWIHKTWWLKIYTSSSHSFPRLGFATVVSIPNFFIRRLVFFEVPNFMAAKTPSSVWFSSATSSL